MRLVSAILFVALTGVGAARSIADDAKPADPKPEVTKKKVPFRVVKMLPETGQVLLFDKNHGNHVVAEVGQTLDGYLVDEIDEDEVTLVTESGAQVILTSPPPPRVAKRTAAKKAEPVDPYADAATDAAAATAPKASADGPVDPYADPAAPGAPGEEGVRVASADAPEMTTVPTVVSAEPAVASGAPKQAPPPPPVFVDTAPAPSDPYADPGIAAFVDAVGATPAPAPAAPAKAKKPAKGSKAAPADADAAAALASAATGAPAPTAAAPTTARATATPTTAAPTTAAPTASKPTASVTIARSELDAALANFGQLAGSFRATFTPDGLRFDTVLEGTLLSKVGLRRGDVITYVDGQPLRSLDDAATLYARAGTVKQTTLQIVRDGKLVTVRVAIQ